MAKNKLRKIRIASRGSELALWQANFVTSELKKIGVDSELVIIKTQGDKIQDLSFDKMEGKGFFTKEIEESLLAGETDLAVHSHKDLTTETHDKLVVAAVSYREDPSELLLIRKECVSLKNIFSLKPNAIVGTSSARRKAQILSFRKDLKLEDLRGNVPTRIKKLRDGKYDAIMLAAAGIERLELDLSDLHVVKLDPKEFIPAPAQGVLALQIRNDDDEVRKIISKLNHPEVKETIDIERKVLNLLQGGCQLPLGVYCEKDEGDEELFKVWAAKSESWDKVPVYVYFESKRKEDLPEFIVSRLTNVKPASVFITRHPRENDVFKNVLSSHGFNIESRSLIEMKMIPMKETEPCSWVFFSSKHAVKYFFEQKPKMENVKIGAVGKGTADAIRKYGKKPDFIGYSTDTRMTARQFASTAGSAKVLFPQAKGSLRSIQQQMNPKQVVNVLVYETIKHPATDLPKAEIVVFTSPSNVDAFFETNSLSPAQKVVAMGGATAGALQKKGIKKIKQPASFDDIGLVQAVMSF